MLFAFVERWHKETFGFYLLIGEMTMKLHDVSCLFHLLIKDRILDRDVFLSKTVEVDLIVELLGSNLEDAEF